MMTPTKPKEQGRSVVITRIGYRRYHVLTAGLPCLFAYCEQILNEFFAEARLAQFGNLFRTYDKGNFPWLNKCKDGLTRYPAFREQQKILQRYL